MEEFFMGYILGFLVLNTIFCFRMIYHVKAMKEALIKHLRWEMEKPLVDQLANIYKPIEAPKPLDPPSKVFSPAQFLSIKDHRPQHGTEIFVWDAEDKIARPTLYQGNEEIWRQSKDKEMRFTHFIQLDTPKLTKQTKQN